MQLGLHKLTKAEYYALRKEYAKRKRKRIVSSVQIVFAFIALGLAGCALFYLWLMNTANKALDKDENKRAIIKYEKLIKITPRQHDYYWNLAIAYLRRGDFKNAEKQVKELRKLGKTKLANDLTEMINEEKGKK